MDNPINENTTLVAAIERNIRAKLQYIPSIQDTMCVSEFANTMIIDSGMPSDTFNAAYGGSIDLETATRVSEYYASKNLPMAWWIGPEADANYNVKSIMQQVGFVHDEYDVGMACDLKTLTLPAYELPEGLSIVQCAKQQHYDDFGFVLSSVFNPIDLHVQKFYKQIATIPEECRESLILLVGYCKGKPVSTAAVFMTDVAGIYDVATMPNQQKQGFGSAMFYAALKYAKSTACHYAVLQASPDGLNIYKRFCFREVCGFNVWSNKKILS